METDRTAAEARARDDTAPAATAFEATERQARAREAMALQALADPTRRAIFELLGRGPCSVRTLADDVPVSRPAVSQHLKVLRDSGLVTVRAEGTRNIYALDPRGLGAVRDYFDQFWTAALTAFADAVDGPHPEGPTLSPSQRTAQEES